MSEPAVLKRLREHLDAVGVSYREIAHPATRTSEESAVARGESLRIGGKALLIKCGEDFRLFVLPADRKFDSTRVKKQLGVKKMRFATPEELAALTGLVPGSVPPYGHPVLPFALTADESLLANPRIAFNAGSLTTSFIMSMEDYRLTAQPVFTKISVDPSEG